MNLYSVELRLAATAYVKAESPEEALERAKTLIGDPLELESDDETISGRKYDDPELPEVSLSPAMTINGFWNDEHVEPVMELVEENI